MGRVRGRSDEFATLVRQILLIEKRRSIRDIAMALGMEYANFHARVSGRVCFKAQEINQLIREVPDPRLCDFLLRDTQYIAIPRLPPAEASNEGALHAAVRLAGESLAAIEQLSEGLVDGQIEAIGYDRLLEHVGEAERAVGVLRAALPGLAPRRFRLGEARAGTRALAAPG